MQNNGEPKKNLYVYKQNSKMPLASQPYKTPYCNRHCQPLLRCPPGSHISSTRKSCVWHGRGSSSKKTTSSPGTILSRILGESHVTDNKPQNLTSSNRFLTTEPSSGRVSSFIPKSGITELKGGARKGKKQSRRKASVKKTKSIKKKKTSNTKRKRKTTSTSVKRKRRTSLNRRR